MAQMTAHSAGSGRIRRGSVVLAASGVLAAVCIQCGRTPADDTFTHHTLMEWVQDSEAAAPAAALPAARTGGGGAPVLYLDASPRMQGFADAAGAFEYARTLRALQGVADRLDAAQPLIVRRIDAPAQQLPDTDQTLQTASRSADFYKSGAGDLAATIRSFVAAGSGGRHQVDLLISASGANPRRAAADAGCAGEGEARCVNAALHDLIDRGWGAHVFAVRSRFAGPIYTPDGAAAGTYSAVAAAAPDRLRPFLLFVFTDDREQLEGLVNKVREALDAAGIEPPRVHELPLTLPLVKAFGLSVDTGGYSLRDAGGGAARANPLHLASDDGQRLDYNGQPLRDDVLMLRYDGGGRDQPPPAAVRLTAAVELTAAGAALLGGTPGAAAHLLQPLTVQEVARPHAWYASPQTLAWPPPGLRLKRLQFASTVSDAAGESLGHTAAGQTAITRSAATQAAAAQAVTNRSAATQAAAGQPPGGAGGHLSLRWSRTGDYRPVILLRVEARLNPAVLHTPAWIDAWSTDDPADLATANRLPYLRQMLDGLERNPSVAAQALKPWYLVIKPDGKA